MADLNARAARGLERRGRGVLPGLVVLWAGVLWGLGGCGDVDRRPAAEPVEEHRAAELVEEEAGNRLVRNHEAPQRLIVRSELPDRTGLTLLFLEGRAASPFSSPPAGGDSGELPARGSVWTDLNGDRALVFDDRGRVVRLLQGGPDAGRPLSAPVAVLAGTDGFRVEERDGSAVLFTADGAPRRLQAAAPEPVMSAAHAVAFAARSPLYFSLAPVQEDEPLFWRINPDGDVQAKGRVTRPDNNMMGELFNTGWAAPAPDEGSYFAPALRPELLRFDAEGDLLWRSTWQPDRALEPPRFTVVDGTVEPLFSVVHHGLAPGPDGRTYLLAASREDRRPDHLLVFDDDGILVREGIVPPGAAIFADEEGRIFALSLEEALSRTPAAERQAFQPFELPSLTSDDMVRLEDHRGQVVVVNFWASWCPPCRREMPLLDELAREMAERDVAVIGLNEDARPGDGRAFLGEIGGVAYANAQGEGELRNRYGYRGLPYTLILDREHRIVQALYGFGTSIDPIRDAVEEALRGDSLSGIGS